MTVYATFGSIRKQALPHPGVEEMSGGTIFEDSRHLHSCVAGVIRGAIHSRFEADARELSKSEKGRD